MVVFEGAYVFDGEQVVGVTGGFGGTVDHDRGGDEVAGGTCETSLPSRPLIQCTGASRWCLYVVELEPGPRPRRPTLVVVADLVPLEGRRLRELVGKLDHRRLLVERLGQVYDLDSATTKRLHERCDGILWCHNVSPLNGRGTPPRATLPVPPG